MRYYRDELNNAIPRTYSHESYVLISDFGIWQRWVNTSTLRLPLLLNVHHEYELGGPKFLQDVLVKGGKSKQF